jgi:hypothetical protein
MSLAAAAAEYSTTKAIVSDDRYMCELSNNFSRASQHD